MSARIPHSLLAVIVAIQLMTTPVMTGQQSNSPSSGAGAQSNPSRGPLSDYVPCLFRKDDERGMRDIEPPKVELPKIDEATAIQLYSATTQAISQFTAEPNYDPSVVEEFLENFRKKVSPERLVNLSRAQAYDLIGDAAQQAKDAVVQDYRTKPIIGPESIPPTQQQESQAEAAVVTKIEEAATGYDLKKKTTIDRNSFFGLFSATTDAIHQFENNSQYNPRAIQEYLAAYEYYLRRREVIGSSPQGAYSMILASANQAVHDLKEDGILLRAPAPPKPAGPPSDQQVLAAEAAVALVVNQVFDTTSHVIKTEAVKTFATPEDISCSMSVLAWKETSDIFGRRVANTYVAIQVTVRNLNAKNEFLIHDIQVAIDSGLSMSELARFQAGRDKLLVRAVAQRGQSEDRRNLIVNSLSAAGAIAGSSSIAGSSDFKTAVAVFQGAFIPGFSTIFPDHTVDQLNHINDLVFSASSTSKVLVPIQGSVPLVTFIAEKPIEQLPFAWCGYTKKKGLLRTHQPHCEADDSSPKADGKELEATPPALPEKQAEPQPNTAQGGSTASGSATWDNLMYRDWKAQALEILQRRTYVVIGGVHIQEVQSAPKLVNLDCPTLPSGPVDMSQAKDGVVTCTVTGNSLDKVASVKLEKGTDKPTGKIKAAKDGNSASLEFSADALSDLSGVYSLYLVDQSGNETDSGDILQLSLQPVITKIEEPSLDLTKPPAKITLDGKHLDQLKLDGVALVREDSSGGDVKGSIQTAAGAKDTKVVVSFPDTSLKGLVADQTFHLSYTIISDPTKQIPQKSIVIKTSGSLPASPAEKSAGATKPNVVPPTGAKP